MQFFLICGLYFYSPPMTQYQYTKEQIQACYHASDAMPIDLVMVTMQNNQLPILQKPVEPYFFSDKLNNISEFIQMDVRIYNDQRRVGASFEPGRARDHRAKRDSFKPGQQLSKQKKD